MSEDVSRAVGAAGTDEIIIAGKKCTTRPLSLKELGEVERECLKQYKREYISTYSDNQDLLPEALRQSLVLKKFEEAAKWDVSDLPMKFVYNPATLRLNKQIEDWVVQYFELDKQQFDILDEKSKTTQLQRLIATALESEVLKEEDYTKFTNYKPKKAKVGYVNWWITACFDGMITLVWAAFKHNGLSKDEVSREMGNNVPMLVHLAREIEHLSAPDVGNI